MPTKENIFDDVDDCIYNNAVPLEFVSMGTFYLRLLMYFIVSLLIIILTEFVKVTALTFQSKSNRLIIKSHILEISTTILLYFVAVHLHQMVQERIFLSLI